MDILRVLSSPDLEVRRKTLSLAMDLVTSRNIEEMVLVLKKVFELMTSIYAEAKKAKEAEAHLGRIIQMCYKSEALKSQARQMFIGCLMVLSRFH